MAKNSDDTTRLFLVDTIQVAALKAMIEKAASFGIVSGVAAILVEAPHGTSDLRYRAVRLYYNAELNHNYFGSAMAMIGTMKATKRSTGREMSVLDWESNKLGGLIEAVGGGDYWIYVAFDGNGTAEQNVEVAELGMKKLFFEISINKFKRRI